MMTDLTYAIGDVHGHLDLLRRAYDAISAHSAGRSYRVIMLGDYIDRGPQSKQVIEFLREIEKTEPVTCLKGNHESMLVETSRARGLTRWWLENGGDTTVKSYGGEGGTSFWSLIPQEHLEWMDALPAVAECAGRLFVHAGFLPYSDLEDQDEEHVLWIRDRFLNAEKAFTGWPYIVHGHTPFEDGKVVAKARVLPWRCNLDSMAYGTGVLTVGVFEGEGGPPAELIYVTEIGNTVERVVIA